MSSRSAYGCVLLLLAAAIGVVAAASPIAMDAEPGEVLVKFRRPLASPERTEIDRLIAADWTSAVGRSGLRRIHSARHDLQTLLTVLRSHPAVEYAEPNYLVRADRVPSDTFFGQLWGMRNTGQTIGVPGTPGADIGATLAWDLSTGSAANTVAVIDTGIDYNHPDLAPNVWSAPAPFSVTIGGSTITCAAGTHGFNAIARTCDPLDDNSHGTHVSGTIGAVGNNRNGVAGVNWTASIIASKFLDANGTGNVANAINAIDFVIQAAAATNTNVRILSNSWSSGGFSQALLDEISTANDHDMLFVASAGNDGRDLDAAPSYPASYNVPNVIAVASTDNRDTLAASSNFGAASVHLAAPGVNILSTVVDGGYQFFSGTSMAAPHVSGAAALVLSRCALDTAALKNLLLASVDPVALLAGRLITGGRLDVNTALRTCVSNPSVTADSVTPNAGSGGAQSFALQYSDTIGGADIAAALVWFVGAGSSVGKSCMALYYQPANALLLRNDAGTDWLAGALGGGGTLRNSQCAIALDDRTTAAAKGPTLTLTLGMTFSPAFAGAKTIAMYAANANGNDTGGWQPRGSWTVPAPPVSADSVTPGSGSGRGQSFAFRYSDAVSAANLTTAWIWFHPAVPSAANSCLAVYVPASNVLLLLNDAATDWLPGVVGSGATLQNGQCAIALDNSTTVTVDGTALTMTLALTFTPAFAGDKVVEMFAQNAAGADTGGWQIRGSWIIP